ncbi:hypothetical protein NDK47_24675 [Brevibacillus ruminantium]|uniref:DUF3139 domain-containing protein n=1 Tax=Brevibacillus ruminantium TaxID=2950604 RepID=A0ABY4WDL6_9BACL|nr:hypothetical protein [Brevibacillus ruminantium]USG65265.1 hypothetical protein NDK47_24675 [Brevibacillus ruminantium]
MRRRVITYILLLVLAISSVGGCSTFFGTITGRMEALSQAISYIHKTYAVPTEHLDATIPFYRYETLGYHLKVYDSHTHFTYALTVRFPSDKDGVDIEEFPYNPFIE